MAIIRRSFAGLPMQLVMSLLWISVAGGPIVNDFNDTHLFNSTWPPHARFHMMMVFSDAVALGIFGLYLCWGPTASRLERLRLSGILGLLYTLGVVIAVLAMPLYGGSLDWKDSLPRAAAPSDGNLVVFATVAMIFAALTALLFRSSTTVRTPP